MKKSNMHRSLSRRLTFEKFEARRMLNAKADIVFLVDESLSDPNSTLQTWLSSMVDEVETIFESASLEIDAHYGLVGFGQNIGSDIRYAHSQLVDPDQSLSTEQLFTDSVTELVAGMGNLASVGGEEDGWDAIEHAIAEYEFRDGAVPIFVLVQNEEARTPLNLTLTRDGILSALESKNVILNTLTVGRNPSNEDGIAIFDQSLPIFDLAPYEIESGDFDNIRILGVEADGADSLLDGQHSYYGFDTADNMIATGGQTTSDALQVSFNGTNTGATGMVGTGKSILIAENLSSGIATTTAGYRVQTVPFEFEDLIDRDSGLPVAGATQVANFTDSHLLSDVSLGTFSFDFYGVVYDELYVWRDGFINFQSSTGYSGTNGDLSQGAGVANEPMIAALWDDLIDSDGTNSDGALVWQVKDAGGADERLIIQWEQVGYADYTSEIDPVTFQAVLHADGQLQLNYLDLDSYTGNVDLIPDNDEIDASLFDDTGGIGATVGIWSGAVDSITIAPGKIVPGPHSFLGSDNRFVGPDGARVVFTELDSNDSYIRMAWDTGGAAWDIGVLSEYGLASPEADALQDAFIDSLGEQILRADATGHVYWNAEPLLALNLGGSALDGTSGTNNEGFVADDDTYTTDLGATVDNIFTTSDTIDRSSNAIPDDLNNPASPVEQVFQSARLPSTGNDLLLTIDTLDGINPIPDGTYIIELFFAQIDSEVSEGAAIFDVLLDEKMVLNDYDIFADYAYINTSNNSGVEYDSQQAGEDTGIVKRFQIDVTSDLLNGDAGLQIELLHEDDSNYNPILSGVRVSQVNPPRVTDVVVNSSSNGGSQSYYDVVNELNLETGDQLRSLAFDDADTIEITFSDSVTVPVDSLSLRSLKTGNPIAVSYLSGSGDTHQWLVDGGASFDEEDQILITLEDTVTSTTTGQPLDGEWYNPLSLTVDTSIYLVSEFPSGNGVPGGDFRFVFNTFVDYLTGDFDGNGTVGQGDLDMVMLNLGETTFPGFVEALSSGVFDGIVSQNELDDVLLNWGEDMVDEWLDLLPLAVGDLNGDGQVSQGDLDVVLLNWGTSDATALEDALWLELSLLIGQNEFDAVLLNLGA